MSKTYEKIKSSSKDDLYVDEMDDGSFGIFGDDTGFCYGIYSTRREADKKLRKLKK
jgi:hypothetical protein